MPRGDRVFLVALLLLAFAGLLPWARTARWGDMVALGWLMAALMVLSPLVALARLWATGAARAGAPDVPPPPPEEPAS